MKINRVEASKHKAGRVLLYLEDGSLLKITEQELLDFRLRAGDDLNEETLAQLKTAAGISAVRMSAAELIGRKPYSRRNLERKLQEKGANEEEARYASDWLQSIGAIDDGEYASMLVRHYAAMGYGRQRIQAKLFEKGVPREFWEEALDQVESYEEQIDTLVRKKLRSTSPDPKEIKRITDMLLRRGFRWNEIRASIERCTGEMIEDEE